MAAPQRKQSPQSPSLWDNPMETRGFEFVEYTAPNPADLKRVFEALGFRAVAHHRSKDVTLYRQRGINFIVNAEPESHAARFARAHGPSACAMAFRVEDAAKAYARAVSLGAKPAQTSVGPMEMNIPAIEGIGGCHIYLVDRRGGASIYDIDFVFDEAAAASANDGGLELIDHLTHNVHRGQMDTWAGYYERLFNFREIRYFDIEGKLTGLKSRAMTSPDGNIRIPINESSDDKSQIEEYLHQYQGEGIQHIALSTSDIYKTVDALRARGVQFQSAPPPTYYEGLGQRVGQHGEKVDELQARGILMDGAPEQGLLLQIFTENMIGRSSSRLFSARATRASARATSRRCSNRSSATRFAAAS